MTHTITVTRNMRGELEAENEVPMAKPGRLLVIRTSKGSRGLRTTASACMIEPSSNGFTSRSYMLFADFSKTVIEAKARATEKAIATQHAAALANIDALMAEAEAFYAKKKAATGDAHAFAAGLSGAALEA